MSVAEAQIEAGLFIIYLWTFQNITSITFYSLSKSLRLAQTQRRKGMGSFLRLLMGVWHACIRREEIDGSPLPSWRFWNHDDYGPTPSSSSPNDCFTKKKKKKKVSLKYCRLFLSASDAYVRSFFYLLYTLIKLYYTHKKNKKTKK